MALAGYTFNTGMTGVVLVPAQTGAAVRLLRVTATSWSPVRIALLADVGGADAVLGIPLYVANRQLDWPLGREFALTTERGQSLGFSAAFQVSPAESSLCIWYELVP